MFLVTILDCKFVLAGFGFKSTPLFHSIMFSRMHVRMSSLQASVEHTCPDVFTASKCRTLGQRISLTPVSIAGTVIGRCQIRHLGPSGRPSNLCTRQVVCEFQQSWFLVQLDACPFVMFFGPISLSCHCLHAISVWMHVPSPRYDNDHVRRKACLSCNSAYIISQTNVTQNWWCKLVQQS